MYGADAAGGGEGRRVRGGRKSGVKNVRKYVSWTEQVWENDERITGQKRPPLFETNLINNSEKKRYNGAPPV